MGPPGSRFSPRQHSLPRTPLVGRRAPRSGQKGRESRPGLLSTSNSNLGLRGLTLTSAASPARQLVLEGALNAPEGGSRVNESPSFKVVSGSSWRAPLAARCWSRPALRRFPCSLSLRAQRRWTAPPLPRGSWTRCAMASFVNQRYSSCASPAGTRREPDAQVGAKSSTVSGGQQRGRRKRRGSRSEAPIK